MLRRQPPVTMSARVAILLVCLSVLGSTGFLDVPASASAAAAAEATLTLTPANGSCGTRVTAQGQHFNAGSSVSLSAALSGGSSGVTLGSISVGDDGRFETEFAVDDFIYGCQGGSPLVPDGTEYVIGADTIRTDPGNGYGPPAALTTFTMTMTPLERFRTTWARTDQPVEQDQADRTWMWGAGPISEPREEPYAESPGETRTVQYFDKGRMEDNAYRATVPWDVTNGLLVVEMVEGRIQLGDVRFDESPEPAVIPVAGDPDDTTSPTYATMALVRDEPAAGDDDIIITELSRDGATVQNIDNTGYSVRAAYRVTVEGIDHQVASPFWDFMNATGIVWQYGQYVEAPLFQNPFYATGYPITEAYWSNVKVGGTDRKVLLQCFQRRCLTYTPSNALGWQVEAGNVGQHYYAWRYDSPQQSLQGTSSTASAVAQARSRYVDGVANPPERSSTLHPEASYVSLLALTTILVLIAGLRRFIHRPEQRNCPRQTTVRSAQK